MPVFAVTTARGPRWDPSRGIRAQAGWDPHAAYMDRLVEQGLVILGGPINGKPDEIALLAMQADTAEHVQVIFDADPWIVSGVLRLASIRSWTLWLGSRPQSGTRNASLRHQLTATWRNTEVANLDISTPVFPRIRRRRAPSKGFVPD